MESKPSSHQNSKEGSKSTQKVELKDSELQKKESNIAEGEKNNEEKKVAYQLVQKKSQTCIDIDYIVAEYYRDSSRSTDCDLNEPLAKKKQKRKIVKVKKTANRCEQKNNQLNLNKFSLDLMKMFDQHIQAQNSQYLTELGSFELAQKKKLFRYLCYGYQQLLENKELKKNDQLKIDELFVLLKKRVNDISEELTASKNKGKQDKVSLTLESHWKFILNLISSTQNSKLRGAVIARKIQPKSLCSSSESDFIQFLPAKRQQQLKAQDQYILKSSVAQQKKIIFEMEKDPTLENPLLQLREGDGQETAQQEIKGSFKKVSPKRQKPECELSKKQKKQCSTKALKKNKIPQQEL